MKEIPPSAVLDAGWRALQRMVEFHRKEAADHYVQLRTPEQLKAESAQYSRNASTMPRVKRLNDVAYVKIPTFSYPGVARDVLSALSGSRGAVIDLRGNTGGYTNEAHILLSALLPSTDRRSGAPTVLEEEYSNRCSVRNEIMPDAKFVNLGVTPRRHMHMSTLVDGHTASAAERFGLTLQLHGHPMVANRGERTYGKFSRLKSIVLPECLGRNAHWLLRYSRSLFRPVDPATGKPIHESVVRNGLRAQIEVPPGENLALHAYRHVARKLRRDNRRQPQQKLAN